LSAAAYRIGADENGLGPRLGPLVVTAVLARVTDAGHKLAGRKARGALAGRLGDSKGLVAHGDVALGEAWARAIATRAASRASTPDELLHAIAADDRAALRAPCPSHVEAQCWSPDGEAFGADDELVATVGADLDRLAKRGVDVVAVRSVIACSRRLNEGFVAGKNRFHLDLFAMERLVLDLRAAAGADVTAVCGMVGGFRRYSGAFGPLGGRLHSIVEESRRRAAYHFPGLGEIAFVQDADASDLLVGLASMVGKYVRELLMARIVRHYRGALPDLPDASGYHDPVTARFVEATALVRTERRVDPDCFERRRADAGPFAREAGA
jgi:ribonuclease HII